MGLAIPEVTYIIRSLKRNGYDVDDKITSTDEAVEQILELYNRRHGITAG